MHGRRSCIKEISSQPVDPKPRPCEAEGPEVTDVSVIELC